MVTVMRPSRARVRKNATIPRHERAVLSSSLTGNDTILLTNPENY